MVTSRHSSPLCFYITMTQLHSLRGRHMYPVPLLFPNLVFPVIKLYIICKFTLYANFLFGPSSLPVAVAQSDKRIAKRTQKKVLFVGMVRQTQSAGFIGTKRLFASSCICYISRSKSHYRA